MSFFAVSSLSAGYGSKSVLNNVTFSCEAGTVTGILGSNGCGKSTLLRSVCSLLPHAGSCQLQGYTLEQLSVRRRAQLCSYIPQRSGISMDLSVLDVVLLGYHPHLPLLSRPTASMQEAALRALSQVGLSGRENESFLTLSEGEKQLCILARTLISDSALLLLDEPESALDFPHRYRVFDLLRQSVSEKQRSALVVLHDPNLALQCCDQLILLRSGSVLAVLRPATDPLPEMEAALRRIYGSVRLQRLPENNQLVMSRGESE